MSKKLVFFIFFGLVIVSSVFVGIGVSASSDYVEVDGFGATPVSVEGVYTLEEMLTYAIQDEFLAQATYDSIIEVYGNIKPFSNIILAEQKHIDLLLPLFDTYEILVPINDSAQYVVVPESISSALSTGIEAEKANIALYEVFLAQNDLPNDVRLVFEYLQTASEHHLQAFSKDRIVGAGYDLVQKIKNQFRNGSGSGQRGNHGQGQSNQGSCGQ